MVRSKGSDPSSRERLKDVGYLWIPRLARLVPAPGIFPVQPLRLVPVQGTIPVHLSRLVPAPGTFPVHLSRLVPAPDIRLLTSSGWLVPAPAFRNQGAGVCEDRDDSGPGGCGPRVVYGSGPAIPLPRPSQAGQEKGQRSGGSFPAAPTPRSKCRRVVSRGAHPSIKVQVGRFARRPPLDQSA
eukprot:1184960-Prorocentrum_minimum.AAC.1